MAKPVVGSAFMARSGSARDVQAVTGCQSGRANSAEQPPPEPAQAVSDTVAPVGLSIVVPPTAITDGDDAG